MHLGTLMHKFPGSDPRGGGRRGHTLPYFEKNIDFCVFESWQTTLKSQGKTITSSAVCQDSKTKKSTRQSFFNFQENLNKGK
jgi:hypothetical protein